MRIRALFIIVWSALSGCMSGAGVETAGESEDATTSTSAAATGSSDSTDTGMPGTDESESTTEDDPSPAYCDLDALPSVPVTWIREQPRLVAALEPTPLGLVALASEGASQPARLEAVDGTGDVLWSEPFGPPGQFVLQWDGSHLYTADGDRVIRFDPDGTIDASWELTLPGQAPFFARGDDVLVLENVFVEDDQDAYLWTGSKLVANDLSLRDSYGLIDSSEQGMFAKQLANGSVLWSVRAGHDLILPATNTKISIDGDAGIFDAEALDDGWFLLGPAIRPSTRSAWMANYRADGQPNWFVEFEACPADNVRIRALSPGAEGRSWMVLQAEIADEQYGSLFVEYDHDGVVHRSLTVDELSPRDWYTATVLDGAAFISLARDDNWQLARVELD